MISKKDPKKKSKPKNIILPSLNLNNTSGINQRNVGFAPINHPERRNTTARTDFTNCPIINNDNYVKIEQLGIGNGGVVTKVKEKSTGNIFAHKWIRLEVKRNVYKSIVNELKLLERCQHVNIVGYYGAFQVQQGNEIIISMEHMDGRSLDVILQNVGRLPQRCVGNITVCMLNGLKYLYEEQKVMHRDVKPSNVLVNSDGKIKLCDFGVSVNLINSMAESFVGTRSYMAPERLEGGSEYTIKSDVWSLGLTLIELAVGVYPIPARSLAEIGNLIALIPLLDASSQASMEETWVYVKDCLRKFNDQKDAKRLSIFELLEHISTQDPPKLYVLQNCFSENFVDFTNSCLKREMITRPNFQELQQKAFCVQCEEAFIEENVYFAKYIKFVIDKREQEKREKEG